MPKEGCYCAIEKNVLLRVKECLLGSHREINIYDYFYCKWDFCQMLAAHTNGVISFTTTAACITCFVDSWELTSLAFNHREPREPNRVNEMCRVCDRVVAGYRESPKIYALI